MARILITGCSTGFGRATAVEATRRGHEVIATARRPETLEGLEVAAKLPLDVDDDVSVANAVEAASPVDVLVNNAGFGIHGPAEYLPIEDVRRVFETNFLGALRMIQAVLPQMRERDGGVIVNVTSLAGRVGSPFNGAYGSSKWALEGLSETLHLEVGHFGIRVVMIEPGVFATGFDDNNRDIDGARPPYDGLAQQWDGALAKLGTGDDPPGPEPVANAIVDAIDDPDTPVRVPVGVDAELVASTRDSMSDAEFEATMRAALGFDW